MTLESTKARMLDLATRYGLTHLGSCCSTLPILYRIYQHKSPDEVVILSSGHAGLALYCCLEEFEGQDAAALSRLMGTHPERDEASGIYCSTGSLGMGLAVAVGYAMAGRTTHVVVSDGECAEGIVWECLDYLGKHDLPLTLHVNANGWSAYQEVDQGRLLNKIAAFCPKVVFHFSNNEPFPDSLQAHYQKMEPCAAPLPIHS